MSVKNLDREGRWRDITIGFRVSEEENERINQLAALSGMTKQAFIIDRLEGNEITVLATTRVQKALAFQEMCIRDSVGHLQLHEFVHENHVAGGRDGQPLGDALDDADEKRFQCFDDHARVLPRCPSILLFVLVRCV